MKKQLALHLLSQLLEWDTNESTAEFDWLRMMVEAKFDHYQGYTPGERFYVHFIHWLRQFSTLEERRVAYEFVKSRLIFISQREMHHLVSLTYPVIQRATRRCIADELGLKVHETWLHPQAESQIAESSIRTLYVGLSDGARIDVFRRENEGVISNEQVVASSEITLKKWVDLKDELRKLLDTRGYASSEATFKRICLIDDFTASGSTMVRYKDNEWKGKLHRFCNASLPYVEEFIAKRALIHVHHYLGTEKAKAKIDELVSAYANQVGDFQFLMTFSHVLSGDVVVDDAADEKLVSLIKKHYDKSIENSHLGVDVWYGYGQCGLPVVLDHNSPNNSIALIWARGEHADAMRPLFPRKQRHVQHGQSV